MTTTAWAALAFILLLFGTVAVDRYSGGHHDSSAPTYEGGCAAPGF